MLLLFHSIQPKEIMIAGKEQGKDAKVVDDGLVS